MNNQDQPSKGKSIATYVLTGLLAFAFLSSGAMKLAGAEELVANFANWGYPPWFLTLTGLIEVGAAILILWPRLSPVGAFLLAATMLGAIATHIMNPPLAAIVPSLVLLTLSATLLALRKDRLLALLPKGERTAATIS